MYMYMYHRTYAPHRGRFMEFDHLLYNLKGYIRESVDSLCTVYDRKKVTRTA